MACCERGNRKGKWGSSWGDRGGSQGKMESSPVEMGLEGICSGGSVRQPIRDSGW